LSPGFHKDIFGNYIVTTLEALVNLLVHNP